MQTKFWDSVEGRYVERSYDAVSAMETFGELPMVGDHVADYGELTPAEIAAPIPVMDELLARSRVIAANDNTTPRANRKAAYVLAYTGRFYPFDPDPADVRIADIAHGLSQSARYNGAGGKFYSTAEHSVLIAEWLLPRYGAEVALVGLLHDAPEPLSGFGDVLRPVKDAAPIIKETETNIWRKAIAPAFDLPLEIPAAVHEADARIIVDEMRANMIEVDPAYTVALGVEIKCWPWWMAEEEFLAAFWALQGMREEVAA